MVLWTGTKGPPSASKRRAELEHGAPSPRPSHARRHELVMGCGPRAQRAFGLGSFWPFFWLRKYSPFVVKVLLQISFSCIMPTIGCHLYRKWRVTSRLRSSLNWSLNGYSIMCCCKAVLASTSDSTMESQSVTSFRTLESDL